MKRACVTGAGGFIGGHLVNYLKDKGYWVRGVDIKPPDFRESSADEWRQYDLRTWEPRITSVIGDVDEVYGLAANMGGIGFIGSHKAEIVRDNTRINLNTIETARLAGVKRYFYTSSACAYPGYLQKDDAKPLREEDAYPADAEDGYGWEKLYFERVCRHYKEDFGLETRVVRFHNCYGEFGTYDGGREKAPAALCRKIALANDGDEIEVWGDGAQKRSYMHVTDCVEGVYRLMQSDFPGPLNLGRDDAVSVNDLIDIIAKIAGKTIRKRYDLSKPQGVRSRNSDNTRLREVLRWEPRISLEEGLKTTYEWIGQQVNQKARAA
jgi:GDP-D-mannose 3',5'-epimerase